MAQRTVAAFRFWQPPGGGSMAGDKGGGRIFRLSASLELFLRRASQLWWKQTPAGTSVWPAAREWGRPGPGIERP